MAKTLVIIPTYNEKSTIQPIIESALGHDGFDVLVVDDGSPDGTAGAVRELIAKDERISLIERPGKFGLGSAYVEGLNWGLRRGHDFFVEMDADGSHDPGALPSFVKEIEKGYGLVMGARYLGGRISVVGWDFHRLMLSKFGNFYASRILGLRLTDLTSGFRCYSRQALESIDLDRIHSNGYAFQIEMAFRVSDAGFGVSEIPIIFYERASGSSKMSKGIIREAVILPWRLRLMRIFDPRRKDTARDLGYNVLTIFGFLLVTTGILGTVGLGWWLGTEGDIIEIIHRAKMGLPGWAWTAMKVGLSAVSTLAGIGLLLSLTIAVFAGGGRK